MTQIRIGEVVASMRVLDGDSLLTDEVMERVVSAVLEAMRCEQRDNASRRRDVKIGSCCSDCDESARTDGGIS